MSEEKEKKAIIDKNTLVPIGFFVIFASVVWFVSSLNFRVDAAEKRLDKIEDVLSTLAEMKSDVAVIKSKVEGMTKMLIESEITIK